MTGSTFTAFSTSPPKAFPAREMASTVLQLPKELRQKVEWVVDASYPFEACGVMIGHNEGSAGQVVVKDVFHARNLNVERARDRFLLDPDDHLAADRVARECGLDVVGFWHSHPDHSALPSATDLEAAWEGHSYLIVSTTAFGTDEVRSWRLDGGRFLEERVSSRPVQLTSEK